MTFLRIYLNSFSLFFFFSVIPLGAIVSAVLPTFSMDKAPKYVQHSTLGYRIAQEMKAYIVSEKKYSERLLRPPPMPSQWTSRSKEAQNKMKYFMIFDVGRKCE